MGEIWYSLDMESDQSLSVSDYGYGWDDDNDPTNNEDDDDEDYGYGWDDEGDIFDRNTKISNYLGPTQQRIPEFKRRVYLLK